MQVSPGTPRKDVTSIRSRPWKSPAAIYPWSEKASPPVPQPLGQEERHDVTGSANAEGAVSVCSAEAQREGVVANPRLSIQVESRHSLS